MAIAFDNSSSGYGAGSSTRTVSHTCSGSNRILFVYVETANSQTTTGVTYGGTSMTKITEQTNGTTHTSLRYIIAPSTGANNIVATASGSAFIEIVATSYTGVKQTGQPEQNNKSISSSVYEYTIGVTTTTDGCWCVLGVQANAPITAKTNSYLRVQSGGNLATMFDTNSAKTPAGTNNMTVEYASGTYVYRGIIASFAPAPSTGNPGAFFQMF